MMYAKEPEYSPLTFPFSGTDVRYRRLNGVSKADRMSGMASLSVVTWTGRQRTLEIDFGLGDRRCSHR
jgi:hypothetical protein